MSDTFQETTRRSWLSRVGGAFVGALVGVLLVVAAVIGLFFNEGRAVTTSRSLAEGAAAVVSVPADPVEPANEGRLVHVAGALSTTERPADPAFGVSANTVRLSRRVEMFQWKEDQSSKSESKLGGSEETVTTYSYTKVWDTSAIDSSQFRQPGGHQNPSKDIPDDSFQVSQARLGAFTLQGEALDALDAGQTLPLAQNQLAAIREATGDARPVRIADNRIYLGAGPAAPQVGDYRVSYTIVPLGPVSVVARQTGEGLEGYQTAAGDRLLLTAGGDVPAERMFSDAVTGNTILTWVLRAVGLLVLGVAFALVLRPVGVLADVVPLFGSLVGFGTGLIALALTLLVGGAVMAVAWVAYRPLVALGILGGAALLAFVVLRLRRSRKAPAPAL